MKSKHADTLGRIHCHGFADSIDTISESVIGGLCEVFVSKVAEGAERDVAGGLAEGSVGAVASDEAVVSEAAVSDAEIEPFEIGRIAFAKCRDVRFVDVGAVFCEFFADGGKAGAGSDGVFAAAERKLEAVVVVFEEEVDEVGQEFRH